MLQMKWAKLFLVGTAIATASSVFSGCGVFKKAKHEAVGEVQGLVGAEQTAAPEVATPTGQATGVPEEGVAEPASVSESDEDLGMRLNVRIVPAGGAEGMPDPSFDLNSARENDPVVPTKGDDVVFEGDIILPDSRKIQNSGKPLYLVWSGSALGSAIQHVDVDHWVKNAQNEEIGEVRRMLGKYDSKSDRWYFPFKEFFEGNGSGEHAGRKHFVRLDLGMANGRRHLILIHFRAKGPTPFVQVDFISAPAVSTASPLEFQRMALQQGMNLGGLAITNPVGRALKVWIKTPGEVAASVYGKVQHHYPVADPILPGLSPPSERDDFYGIEVLIRKAVLRFSGQAGSHDVEASGGWQSFDIAPSEKIQIDWIAQGRELATRCALPLLVPEPIWAWYPETCGVRGAAPLLGNIGGGSPCILMETRIFNNKWDYIASGWSSSGWSTQIRVSNPWEGPESAVPMSDVGAPALASGLNQAEIAPLGKYSCQGVF